MWAPKGQRPIALGHHRYKWLYVTAFTQPVSGETVWYLSTGVSKAFFAALLAAFAHETGAGRGRKFARRGWRLCSGSAGRSATARASLGLGRGALGWAASTATCRQVFGPPDHTAGLTQQRATTTTGAALKPPPALSFTVSTVALAAALAGGGSFDAGTAGQHRRGIRARLRPRRGGPRRPDHHIGHDTIEKPPFIMGEGGPQVIHIGYAPANKALAFLRLASIRLMLRKLCNPA